MVSKFIDLNLIFISQFHNKNTPKVRFFLSNFWGAAQKVQKDYDREYNAYKKQLAQYETYRDREYETQSQIYFSPEEQTNDILHWLGTNGENAIVVSVEDSAGIKKDIHSFADIKDWVDKHDYDSSIKSDFRDYKGGD